MYRYLIIIEPGEHNYSAYVPDLPGCVTTGATYEEVQKNMREAIALHLRGMIEDQEPIPVPQTTAAYADVPLPNSAAWPVTVINSIALPYAIAPLRHGTPEVRATATQVSLCWPNWKVGYLEYDPFDPDAPVAKGTSMYDETLNSAESLIKRTWYLRRIASLLYVEEAVNDLNRLFAYLRENLPPPIRLEQRFQVLYAQVLRLNAVVDVENQRYQNALEKFTQMNTIATAIDHPATIALSLLGKGTELDRFGRHQEAIVCLEAARDESFRASKHIAALTNAILPAYMQVAISRSSSNEQ